MPTACCATASGWQFLRGGVTHKIPSVMFVRHMVAYGSLDACAHVSPAPLPAPGRWSATNPPPQHGSGASTSVVEPCVVFATYSLTLDPLRAVEETKDQAHYPRGVIGDDGVRANDRRSSFPNSSYHTIEPNNIASTKFSCVGVGRKVQRVSTIAPVAGE